MSLSQPSAPRATRPILILIFIIMLMDILGISLLTPIAPYIVHQYSDSGLMVTLLTGIYAAAQFIAAPVIGKISDRTGRKPVLLTCVFGSAIGYFIFGFGRSLPVLFFARLVDGITGGNLSTAQAYLIDISKPEERAKNMSLIGMAYGIGYVLGPAVGGILGQFNLNAPVFAAGIVSLASAVLIYFTLPESLHPSARSRAPLSTGDLNPLRSISGMIGRPGLGLLLIAYALFNFCFDGLNSITTVFVVDRFNPPAWETSLLVATGGLATAVVQGLLARPIISRFGEKRMAAVSLLSCAAGGLFIFMSPSFLLLFPIILITQGLTGFAWSTLGALCANQVSHREQGQLSGVNAALGSLVAALGPVEAGLIYDQISPAASAWMSAAILAVGVLLLVRTPPAPIILKDRPA